MSSSYIFLFILFGAFLERAGMIKLFTDVSLGLVGHKQGGAAKVAVVSSGLMGTISGSGVANVVTTGQFTIPLMKSFGYRSAFAGGVESTASMGGQLMPPVMGAVAFIMAETLGVEYVEVVKAALIPALLYFASAFWMVHLEAGRHGLKGMSKADLPSPREGDQGKLVSDPAAGGSGLPALFRLHAALRGHDRTGADSHADPRRLHRAWPAAGGDPRDPVLDRPRRRRRRLLRIRHHASRGDRRRADRLECDLQGRARDAGLVPRQPGRRRQDRAARRHRLRAGRHHHRDDDADRVRPTPLASSSSMSGRTA